MRRGARGSAGARGSRALRRAPRTLRARRPRRSRGLQWNSPPPARWAAPETAVPPFAAPSPTERAEWLIGPLFARTHVSGVGKAPGFQLDEPVKFQGRSSSMRLLGWPLAMASSAASMKAALVDRDVRNRAPDRGAARPTDPSRPYPGNERPERPPQPLPRAKQGLYDLTSASPSAGLIPTPSDHFTPKAAVAVFCSALWSGFSAPLTFSPVTDHAYWRDFGP